MAGLGIIKRDKTELTREELIAKLPRKKNTITDEMVAVINEANNDPMFNGNEFINSMIEYQSVMNECSASIPEYINALKFCAYLEVEDASGSVNLTEAYIKSRGKDRFVLDRMGADTASSDYNALTSAASRYRKTPMVKQILTQSDMPLYLMFQPSRYKAVQVLHNEMIGAAYSKDRITAAKFLLDVVKPPENLEVELRVGPNQEAKDMSTQLSEQLAASVAMQRKMLEAGMDFKQATTLGIKLGEPDEDVLDVELDDV